MSAFKDLVAADRDVVIDLDYFAEEHDIDGVTLKVVLENEAIKVVLENEAIKDVDDVEVLSKSSMVLFAKTEELGERRMRGETLYIDDVGYTVERWLDEMGVTKVTLSMPESW